MIRLSRSIALAAPADRVWQTVRAFGDLALWHPAVSTCDAGAGQQCRVGTVRHVVTRDGLSMDEELVSVSERDRRLEILTRVAPFPVSMMRHGLTVFGVTAGNGALLRWDMRADGSSDWQKRISNWFGEGYIPAGLRGLDGLLRASNNNPIN
jgi:hypothetical protein